HTPCKRLSCRAGAGAICSALHQQHDCIRLHREMSETRMRAITMSRKTEARYIFVACLFLFFFVPLATSDNTCLDCHSALDAPLQVTADEFNANIHAQKGLTCASCHGGNPNSADDAMN